MAIGSTFTVNPNVYKKIGFEPDRDFRPISILTKGSLVLALHPTVPANSVAEFVTFAKSERVTYGTGGNGSPGHLAMEYFRLRAGFETVPVPFRSLASMLTDLVAGQIKVAFPAIAGVIEHVRAGRLKGLAISAGMRSSLAPDVPTIAESGYPDFKVETQLVMLAPAGIAEPLVELLEHHVRLALTSPELTQRLRALGYEIAATTGADARAQLQAERALWAKIIKEAAIRVD
jgi:tripartite-type tricarboxylate transporter receptor subunit TctC